MDDITNIETYAKILVGLTGAIAAFIKIRDSFSVIRKKQELKLDLEILEKLKQNENLFNDSIEEKIKNKIDKSFEDNSDNITNFLVGIVVFVGFGFWTIDLFKNYENFNGWSILTLFCSLLGLVMLFDTSSPSSKKIAFFKIGFFDKDNFKYGLLITLFAGILTLILIIKIQEFSFWIFLTALFFIIGLFSLIKNIKRIS
jgi:hypothetical protein